MFHFVKDAWLWLWGWLPYILPALSNLILVLLGVLLSLPTLADKIEKTPKYRTALGVICLIAGIVGFWFDVSQRRSSDQTNKQLLQDTGVALKKSNDLIDKTTSLVTSTNDMVSRLGLMEPQIIAATDHLANIDKKLDLAKKQNNTELVAALQADKQHTLSTLLTMAPGIIAEMQYWANKWDNDDRGWDVRIRPEREKLYGPHPSPQQEVERILEPLLRGRTDMNRRNTEQVLPAMMSANYLREQLLHGSELTPDDNKNALIFAKVLAGEPINWAEMRNVTTYMGNLVKKFATPSLPSNLRVTLH